MVYPKSNRRLFGSIAGSGAVVPEYHLGEPLLAWRLPARNRIIAGLSDAVVVVEAPEESGALITARHALEAGRDVWAVPGPIGFAECLGSNALLADGAGVSWDIDLFEDTVPHNGKPHRGCLLREMRRTCRFRLSCRRKRPRRLWGWVSSRRRLT